MPNLRFVQLLTSGHDHMRGSPLFSEGEEDNHLPRVPAATCSGVSARAIAQYVVLQVLSWAHQHPQARDVMGQRRWVGPEKAWGGSGSGSGFPMANMLAGRRVGIWGYGSIGRQGEKEAALLLHDVAPSSFPQAKNNNNKDTSRYCWKSARIITTNTLPQPTAARILHAMGMKIIACTSSEKTTPESRRLHGAPAPGANSAMGDDEGVLPLEWHSGGTRAGLHKFLAAGLDVLAVFTPLTPSTRHALARAELDILSSSSSSSPPPFLVNVSRGPILVQDDLVAALHDGRLSGAALDVADPEPLPADHELWRAPGVSITPHVSWCFAEYVEDCLLSVFEENLGRLVEKGGREGFVNQIR